MVKGIKKVQYNGKNQSYYPCTNPEVLEVDKTYTVIAIEDRGWQTNYTLEGVKGYFNSVWFDEI